MAAAQTGSTRLASARSRLAMPPCDVFKKREKENLGEMHHRSVIGRPALKDARTASRRAQHRKQPSYH
jgi:hypothetical protein